MVFHKRNQQGYGMTKKSSLLCFILVPLLMGSFVQLQAAVVAIGGPGIAIKFHQPVQAIVVDPNGATVQQTVYYDPAIGGVDLDTSWAGPNASVYFPEYGSGYIWYNGVWVGREGYYWDGAKRVYVNHPDWNNHWAVYWGGQGHWHGGGYYSRPHVSVHVHETVYEHGGHHHHH